VTYPSGETPAGALNYEGLEEFSGATASDFVLSLINSVTAVATGYTNIQEAIEKVASQISIPEFADLLLAAFEGIVGSFFDFLPWFINLSDFLGFDLNMNPDDFNPLSLGIEFIKRLLSFLDPTNLSGIPILGDFIEAITGSAGGLGDLTSFLNAPFGAIQDVIDQIWDAFDSGILGNTQNNPLSTVFTSIFAIFGTGSNAQAVNVIQDVRLDALAGGGSGLSDAFDGGASSALNSTNWNQSYSGSGSGTCGLSGDGFAKWNTSGSGARTSRNRYKTATTTDTQSVAISVAANVGGAIGDNPAIYLLGRMNSAETAWVEARVTTNSAEIGYVVGGSYTRLGAAATLTADTSGTWQLKLGTVADDREFVLLRNGATVISRTDTGDASTLGASNRYAGFSMKAGWTFSIFFGFPLQVAPPPCGAWAASDRQSSS
jgi:hypothetical protein